MRKYGGCSLVLVFFTILLSTFLVNFFILIAVFSSLLLILKNNDFHNIFIKNTTNFCLLILTIFFCFSFFYTENEFSDSLKVFKKYIKFLYIPLCFYILQIAWVREKTINFFVYGCTIVLIMSYLKFFNILDPVTVYKIFSLETYNEKLNSGIQVFQSSITHGIVFSFFFIYNLFKS